ncbi:hypothetical protein [Hymenobacter coalescens]
MKRQICVVAVGVLSALPLLGLAQGADRGEMSGEQQLAESLGTERLPLSGGEQLLGPNAVRLLQEGSRNEAAVQQRYSGEAALGNLVRIVQAGAANVVGVSQYGAANQTTVEQYGIGNRVESQLNGTGIESDIRQQGNQNVLQQELSLDNRRYLVEQQGNGNELLQRETSAAPGPGYEVRMQGNGIRIIIERGQALP